MAYDSMDESSSPELPPLPAPWGPRRCEALNQMQPSGCHPASKDNSSRNSPRCPRSYHMPTLITDAAREDGFAARAEVQRLLAAGADPNSRCPVYGFTPLIAAVWRKDRFLVDLLISHPACDVNRVGVGGMTPLMYAALGNRTTPPTSSNYHSQNSRHAHDSQRHRDEANFGHRSNEAGNLSEKCKVDRNYDVGNEKEEEEDDDDLVAVLLRAPGCDRALYNDNGHNAYDLAFARGHSEACVLLRYNPAVQSAPLLAAQGHCEAIEALVRQGVPPNGPLKPTLHSLQAYSSLPYSPPSPVLSYAPTAQSSPHSPPHPRLKKTSTTPEKLVPAVETYASAMHPSHGSPYRTSPTGQPIHTSPDWSNRSAETVTAVACSLAPVQQPVVSSTFHSPSSSTSPRVSISPSLTPTKHSLPSQSTPPSSSSSRQSTSSQPSLDLLRKHLGQSSKSSTSGSTSRRSVANSSNSESTRSTPSSNSRTASLTPESGSTINNSSGVKSPIGANALLPSSSPVPRVLFQDDNQGDGTRIETTQAGRGGEGDEKESSTVHFNTTPTRNAHLSSSSDPNVNPASTPSNSRTSIKSSSNTSSNRSPNSRSVNSNRSSNHDGNNQSPSVVRRRVSTSQTRPGERSPPHLRARSPLRPTTSIAATTAKMMTTTASSPASPASSISPSPEVPRAVLPSSQAPRASVAAVAVPPLSPGISSSGKAASKPSPGFSPGSTPPSAMSSPHQHQLQPHQHQNEVLLPTSPVPLGPRGRRDLHTPLMAAAAHRRPAVVQLLLRHMKSQAARAAVVAANVASTGGEHLSAPSQSWPLLPFGDAIEGGGHSTNSSSDLISSSFFAQGTTTAPAAFVTSGHDINYQNPKGGTALHYAAASGSERVVLLLLVAGADRHLKDRRGLTPLQWAMRRLHDLESEGGGNGKEASSRQNGRPSMHGNQGNQRKGLPPQSFVQSGQRHQISASSPTTRTPPEVNATTHGGGRGAAAVFAEREDVLLRAQRGSPNGDLNGSLLPEYIPSPAPPPPQATRHSREQERHGGDDDGGDEGNEGSNNHDDEDEDASDDDNDDVESEFEARSAKVEACEALWRVIDVLRSDPQAGSGPLALAKATPRHKRHHSSGLSAGDKHESISTISGSNSSNGSSHNAMYAEKGHGALQWAAAVGDQGALVALVKQGVNINLVTPGLRAETALAAAALGLSALISTNHMMGLSGGSGAPCTSPSRNVSSAGNGSSSTSRSTAGSKSSSDGKSRSRFTSLADASEQRSPSRSPTKGSSSSLKISNRSSGDPTTLGIGVPGRNEINGRCSDKSTISSTNWNTCSPRATSVVNTKTARAAVVASAVQSEVAALAALQLLLDHPKCNLEQRDSQGYTPLMLASTYGQEASVVALLNAGADRFAALEQHERSGGGGRRREGGVSRSFTDARALATSHGHLFLANAVLTADPSRISLPMACYRGDLPIVEGLLRQLRHPNLVNAPGFFFDFDAISTGDDDIDDANARLKSHRDKGSDNDDANNYDYDDDGDEVDELGCYRGDRKDNTASIASRENDEAAEGAAVDDSISQEHTSRSSAQVMPPQERHDYDRDLEDDGGANQRTTSSIRHHHHPQQQQQQQRVEEKSDPFCGFGRLVATPLVAAMVNGQVRIVQRLLELPQLKVDQPNPEGETALMLASALPHQHQSMWPLLLRAGADPHGPVDCRGANAVAWALREQGFGAMLALLAAHAAATAANALSPPDDEENPRRLRADGYRPYTFKEAEEKTSQLRKSAQQLHVPPYPALPPTPRPRPHRPRPPPRPAPSLSSTSIPPRAHHSSSSAAAAAATAAKDIDSTATPMSEGAICSNGTDAVQSDSASTGNDATHISHNNSSNSIRNASRMSELEFSRRPLARPAPRSPRNGKSPSSSSDGGIPKDSPLISHATPSDISCGSSPAGHHSLPPSLVDNIDSSKSTAADAAATTAAAKSFGLAVNSSSAPTQPSNTFAVPAASSLYADGESAMPWPEEGAIDTEPAAPQPESPTLPVACQAPSSSSSSPPPLLRLQPPSRVVSKATTTTIPANSGAYVRRSNEEENEEGVKITTASSDHPLARKETLELVELLQRASITSDIESNDCATTLAQVDKISAVAGLLQVAVADGKEEDDEDDEVRLRDTCSLPRQPLRWPSEDSALLATTSSSTSLEDVSHTKIATKETSTAALAIASAAALARGTDAVKTTTAMADLTSANDSRHEEAISDKEEVTPETSPFLLTLAAALTVAPRHVPSSSTNRTISDQHDASSQAGEPQISSPALAASAASAAAAASTVAAPLSASSSSSSGQLVNVVAKEVHTGGNANEDATVQREVEAMKSDAILKEMSETLVGNGTPEQLVPLGVASSTATAAENKNTTNKDDSSSSSSSSSNSGSDSSRENARGSARVGSMSSSIPLRWPSEDRAIVGSGFTQPSPPPLPSSALPESSETLNATLSMDAPDSGGDELHVDAINSNGSSQVEEHQVATRYDTPDSSSAAPSPFLSALLHLSGAPSPPSSLPVPSTSGQSANPKSSTVNDAETARSTPGNDNNLLSASCPEDSDEVDDDADKTRPKLSTDAVLLDANHTSSSVSGSSNNNNDYISYNKSSTRRNAFASDVALGPDPRLSTLRRLQPAAGVGTGAAPRSISEAAGTPVEPATSTQTATLAAIESSHVASDPSPDFAAALSARPQAVTVPLAAWSSASSVKSDVPADVNSVAVDDSIGNETNKRLFNVEFPMPRKDRVEAAPATAATAATSTAAASPPLASNRGVPATTTDVINVASPSTSASIADMSASDAVEPSATSSARPQFPAKSPPSARILRRRAVSAAVVQHGTSASSALLEASTGTGTGAKVPVTLVPRSGAAAITANAAPDRAKNAAVIGAPRKVEPAASPVREPRKVLLRKRGGSAVSKTGESEAASTEAETPPEPSPPRVPSIDNNGRRTSIKSSDNIYSNNSAVSRTSTTSSGSNIPRLKLRITPASISSDASSPQPLSSSSSSLRSAQPVHAVNAAPTAPLLPTAVSSEAQKSRVPPRVDTAALSLVSSTYAREVNVDVSSASSNALPDVSSAGDSPTPLSSSDSKGLKSTNHGLW